MEVTSPHRVCEFGHSFAASMQSCQNVLRRFSPLLSMVSVLHVDLLPIGLVKLLTHELVSPFLNNVLLYLVKLG